MRLLSFSPKIIHKGLALVLIPFCLNAVWVILLSNSLARTAKVVEIERNQTSLIEHLYRATWLTLDATGNVFSYLNSSREKYKELEKQDRFMMQGETAYIHDQIQAGTITREQIGIANGEMDQLNKAFDQMEATMNDGEPDAVAMIFKKKNMMRRLISEAFLRTGALVKSFDQQSAQLDNLRKEESASRQGLKDVVAAGIIGNLILALLLVLFFVSDISRRLAVLMENARRLPKRLALEKPVSGGDELSYLDQAIHSAADDLQKSYDHRASLMQMVAHDLRSPLQASLISLEIVTQFEADKMSKGGYEHIQRIQSNNRRLIALINDLLTLDALELGALQLSVGDMNVRELAQEAIETFDGLAKVKNIDIVNECEDLAVVADSRRIMQVVINYLANAIKFSPVGSVIKITSTRASDCVVMAVVDQGVGMTKEESRQVFDKFFQASEGRKKEGFGLGLAICKLIVESHGGKVGVTSEKGKGSRFWFTLTNLEPEHSIQSLQQTRSDA